MPSLLPGKTTSKIRRIGVLTAGGDCPGLNAVIRAVVKSAVQRHGWQVLGIRDGFEGLISGDEAVTPLTIESVYGILSRGGTILGAASRANPFLYTKQQQGSRVSLNVTPRVLDRIGELGLDAVVVIGGDGTMRIARELHEMGAPLVGVPKTIDNDVEGTDTTFGFDTAVSVATEAIDRLRTTAESHHRAMIVEVMGRQAGWIALHSGVAGGADIVLIPEHPFDLELVYQHLCRSFETVQRSAIVVVAEGAYAQGDSPMFRRRAGSQDKPRLGGIGEHLAYLLQVRQEEALASGSETGVGYPRHRLGPCATRRHAQQHRSGICHPSGRSSRAADRARPAGPHGRAARLNADRSAPIARGPRSSHRPSGLRYDVDGSRAGDLPGLSSWHLVILMPVRLNSHPIYHLKKPGAMTDELGSLPQSKAAAGSTTSRCSHPSRPRRHHATHQSTNPPIYQSTKLLPLILAPLGDDFHLRRTFGALFIVGMGRGAGEIHGHQRLIVVLMGQRHASRQRQIAGKDAIIHLGHARDVDLDGLGQVIGQTADLDAVGVLQEHRTQLGSRRAADNVQRHGHGDLLARRHAHKIHMQHSAPHRVALQLADQNAGIGKTRAGQIEQRRSAALLQHAIQLTSVQLDVLRRPVAAIDDRWNLALSAQMPSFTANLCSLLDLQRKILHVINLSFSFSRPVVGQQGSQFVAAQPKTSEVAASIRNCSFEVSRRLPKSFSERGWPAAI
jgi:6-phosphofructokinase